MIPINTTITIMTNEAATATAAASNDSVVVWSWLIDLIAWRRRFFLETIEPIIVACLGPVVEEQDYYYFHQDDGRHRRRLGLLPSYVSNVKAFKETSMSFATLIMLFVTLSCVFLIFLSCFYHNQKTSPLFSSPRRHRLPKLVPPALPVDGYFRWVRICLLVSDEEIIHRVGYDSLIFLRFHRLALRCIVKMSVFSFVVLLPLNFTGGGHNTVSDLKEYVGSLFFTDFMRFTMANITAGSPRLWIHCFAAYLLTAIVMRELLVEYETFNGIRHRYLLSREPHLRTVLVTNIPRHLRSSAKITNYFQNVYPRAVKAVFLCQNVQLLEQLVQQRTAVLSKIENEILLLCRYEKKKIYQQTWWHHQNHHGASSSSPSVTDVVAAACCCYYCCCGCCCDDDDDNNGSTTTSPNTTNNNTCCCCCPKRSRLDGTQEKLAAWYSELEDLNHQIENERQRRRRVMKMLDRMGAGEEGARDIDYVLAAPFVDPVAMGHEYHPQNKNKNHHHHDYDDDDESRQRRVVQVALGLEPPTATTMTKPPPAETTQTVETLPPHQYQPPVPTAPSENIEQPWHESPPISTNDTEMMTTNQLRSRSPVVISGTTLETTNTTSTRDKPDGLMKIVPGREDYDNNKDQIKKRRKRRNHMFDKARRAIRRYGGLTNKKKRDVSFLGNPILHSPNSYHNNNSNGGTIEDHVNEVTDKAFVVMRTFTAATIAIQSMHSSKPGSMQVSTAPEPRDILWDNIYMSKGAHRTRSVLGTLLVLLIITFYVVPVAIVSLLVSETALVSLSPRLAQLSQASAFFSAVIALVQPMCIVGLQQLLPPLFMAIGKAEGITAFSEIQMRTFSRYFLFQVMNVFLATTIAGSIFDTTALIIEKPEVAFEMLGNSLPKMSSFFISFVTIKTFFGLGLELVRTMALVQATVRYLLFPNATLRMKRQPMAAMRAIDDPGWFPFHKILAQDMLVVVISVVFAVVAPLVTLPCMLFCLCSRIIWTHHHLYVYESVFESGGQFWPKIFRRFVFGLIIAQSTITGQFILKDARHEAYATIALMFLTYLFLRSTRARYDPTSSTLPLEVATVMDISLQQEEEVEEEAGRVAEARRTVSPREQDINHGTYIGRYDPFELAYIQPALRANPRARPEQPFPVSQLGPEDMFLLHNNKDNNNANNGVLGASTSAEGVSCYDHRATVRLKNMNKQDRKLIDRWWNDQLQRAGKQNLFAVLIGEECGTLSTICNADVELRETRTFDSTSQYSLV